MAWKEVDIEELGLDSGWKALDEEDEPSGDPWYEDFGEGVVTSGLSTAYGIKDLIPGMEVSPEEKARLEDWKQDAGESGWGTGGRVVGEIAQLAIPGGAAIKGARALAKAKNMGTAGIVAAEGLADIATAGGMGALRLPEEGQTRLGNASTDAQGAALGKMLDPFLLRGIVNKSPGAKELISKGVNLTPGQASSGPVLKLAEGFSEWVPGLARGTRQAKDRANKQWGEYIMRESVPPSVRNVVSGSGREGYRTVQQAYNKAYKNAWANANVPGDLLTKTADDIRNYSKVIDPSFRYALNRVKAATNKSRELAAKGMKGPAAARKVDRAIQRELTTAYKNPGRNSELISALEAIKKQFRDGLPGDTSKKLRGVDKHWSKRLVVRDATRRAKKNKGEFTPDQLRTSSDKIGGAEKGASGTSPLFAKADQAEDILHDTKAANPLNWIRVLLSDYTPKAAPMDTIGDLMTGQSPIQKQSLLDILNASRVGAAVANDEE